MNSGQFERKKAVIQASISNPKSSAAQIAKIVKAQGFKINVVGASRLQKENSSLIKSGRKTGISAENLIKGNSTPAAVAKSRRQFIAANRKALKALKGMGMGGGSKGGGGGGGGQ